MSYTGNNPLWTNPPGVGPYDAKAIHPSTARAKYGAKPGQRLVAVRADVWNALHTIVDNIPVFMSDLLAGEGVADAHGDGEQE